MRTFYIWEINEEPTDALQYSTDTMEQAVKGYIIDQYGSEDVTATLCIIENNSKFYKYEVYKEWILKDLLEMY